MQKHRFGQLELDSKCELEFCYWMEELRKDGYIQQWIRSPSYQMTDGLVHRYVEERKLKTKVVKKEKEQVLLEPSSYTPDFGIQWNKKAQGIFYQYMSVREKITAPFVCDPTMVSVVEIKGSATFDPNNMMRLFKVNQKFMWKTNGVFVNLTITDTLFKNTFTPQDAHIIVSRKNKQPKWKRVSLKDYLSSLK